LHQLLITRTASWGATDQQSAGDTALKLITLIKKKQVETSGKICYKKQTTKIQCTVYFKQTAGRLELPYCLRSTWQQLQLPHDSLAPALMKMLPVKAGPTIYSKDM
jgi:hypothetical protein